MLARAMTAVVQVPDFGPLVLRVPLAKLVAKREHSLLGAGLLFVASPAAECRIKLMLADSVEQSDCLQSITTRQWMVLLGPA